jgi:hypothetical protein
LKKLVWIVASINLVAAGVLAVARTERPTKQFWEPWAGWLIACTITTLIAPLLLTFATERSERKKRKKLQRERAFSELLTGALVAITRDSNLDCTRTGVQAFLVTTTYTLKPPFRRKVHERAARVKLSFNPPPSGIPWQEGKGLIGRCWSERANVVEDLRTSFGPYLAYSKEQWDALAARERFGLSYEEFTRTKSYYGLVAAVPILGEKGEYLGCVSLDTPADCPQDVDRNHVAEHLRVPAVSIQNMLAAKD